VWIPHQAGQEFVDGRLTAIQKQRKQCEDFLGQFQNNINTLASEKNYPHVKQETLKQLSALGKIIEGEIREAQENMKKQYWNDPIRDFVFRIFNGKVGKPFDGKRHAEITKEADSRFKAEIPPGYMDKPEIGDLLIWLQMIEEAKTRKAPAIFVTGDLKEDWWSIVKDGNHKYTIGPRPELAQEIKDKTNAGFQMYSTSSFMEEVGKRLNVEVSAQAIDQARVVEEAKIFNVPWADLPKASLIAWTMKLRSTVRRFATELEQARLSPPVDTEQLLEIKAMAKNWGKRLIEIGNVLSDNGLESAKQITASGRDIELATEEAVGFGVMIHSLQDTLASLRAGTELVMMEMSALHSGS
jgi:hypothetical protein